MKKSLPTVAILRGAELPTKLHQMLLLIIMRIDHQIADGFNRQ